MRGLQLRPASVLLGPSHILASGTACSTPLPIRSNAARKLTTAARPRRTQPPAFALSGQQIRHRHVSLDPRATQVPAPTPFVPDVATFLKLIGRDLKKFTDKFPSWEALFTLKSAELKELGVQPARTRKYLLRWLEKFRNGEYGPGGDFAYVKDGVAALRVGRDIKRDTTWVVNIPLEEDTFVPAETKTKPKEDAGAALDGAAENAEPKGKTVPGASAAKLAPTLETESRAKHAVPRLYHSHGTGRISGPFVMPNPRQVGGATVRLMEGMWEERRGVKLDGGERRRDRKRFEKMVKERKAQREARAAEAAAKRGGG